MELDETQLAKVATEVHLGNNEPKYNDLGLGYGQPKPDHGDME